MHDEPEERVGLHTRDTRARQRSWRGVSSTAEWGLRPQKNLAAQARHDRGTLTRTYPPPSERHSSTKGAFACRPQRFARVNMGGGRARAPREEQGFRTGAPRAVGTSHLDEDERFTDVLGGGTGEATFLQ